MSQTALWVLSFSLAAPPSVVAVVNGEPIPRSELDAALAQRPAVVTPLSAAQQRELQEEALSALIDERLIRQFLAKNAPPVDKERVDRQVATLQRALASQGKPLDDYLAENHQTIAQLRANIGLNQQWNAYAAKKITDADLQKYFADNRDFFDKTTVRVSHIVLRVAPDAPAAEREAALKKLAELRQEIVAKKITFAEAATKHSQCPSAPRGGDLDFITRKWMVEEPFGKAAFALKIGELSEIVTTDYGLHLMLVTDRKPGTPATFAAVADEVRECALEELRQTTLHDLRRAAKVEFKLP
ncbi:MAG TPA: peptidylprolyl isomerase, partial [Gemmataceae bacterium]|nr:peptidylprolyl isomerase [Gemmataceae bacterium]